MDTEIAASVYPSSSNALKSLPTPISFNPRLVIWMKALPAIFKSTVAFLLIEKNLFSIQVLLPG